MTKEFVEVECTRLADELLATNRVTTKDELAYWLKYAAKIGYELGWRDNTDGLQFKCPQTKEVPPL